MKLGAQNHELFEPGEYLQRTARPGYFSVLTKNESNYVKQDSFNLDVLPAVVGGLNPEINTWITQAVFNGPNRRAVNLRDVGLLFVDLDTYRVPALAAKSPEDQAELLNLFCHKEGIPSPSIILFSGRGLQAKWLLSEAVAPVNLYEWNGAQLALVKLLLPFAADINSKDVSRVLRVDQTTNTKSGEKCRVVHVTGGAEGCPARYDFQELIELLCQAVPMPKERVAPAQPNQGTRPALYLPLAENFKRLNWFRLRDIRTLWNLRGGVPEGWREVTLFWELNFLLKAEPGRVHDLWYEAAALAAEIAPGKSFYKNSDLSTLYRKAQEAKAGQAVDFNGKHYSALYTPRNSTLIDRFNISDTEQRELLTVISSTEKYRRLVEKRRAAGVKEQPYKDSKPWEALGIARRTYYWRIERGERDSTPYLSPPAHKSKDKLCNGYTPHSKSKSRPVQWRERGERETKHDSTIL